MVKNILPVFGALAFAGLPDYTLAMQETGKEFLLLKKSYEIAYALFRIAAKISEKSFAENMGRQGTNLLGAVALGKYDEAAKYAAAIEYFIKLGVDLDFISLPNGDILFRELSRAKTMFSESGKPAIASNQANVDISNIFSEETANVADEISNESYDPENAQIEHPAIRQEINPATDQETPKIIHRVEIRQKQYKPAIDVVDVEMNDGHISPAIRQSRMLDKIRQSGNCRIKDLQEVLPECSERTIRYDLQTLVEQGLIERRGNGGPAVYYRLKQAGGMG